ncbi:MAG: type II toxin-antitoxin system prevent-host-death family antitoxin [Acidobacteria bacterium]|nr:type II toxin-antitoxin system prevent-host-death family antitoxin [Acidobacteriota bacterium]
MIATKAARTTPPVGRPGARPRVGVREIRQNLTVYLERVIAGERFDVTARGHVVAMLIPVPPASTLVERLIAEGRAIPATRDGRALPPLRGKIPAGLGKRLQQALQESREDRL